MNEKMAEYYGLPINRECLVIDVTLNGPASYYGIQPGDIIIAISGKEVNCTESLKSIIEELKIEM